MSYQQKEEQRLRSKRPHQRAKLSFPVLTQQQQLEEAVETERVNRESLQQLLKIEEERKKVHLRRKKGRGPTVLFHSSRTSTSISWSSTATLPPVFSEVAPSRPYVRCVVSHAPAHYLHRWTGQPFRGVEEWKAIEEAWRRGEKFVNAEQMDRDREREREEKERERRKTTGRKERGDSGEKADEKAEVEAQALDREEGREGPAKEPKRTQKKRTRGAAEEQSTAKNEVEERGAAAAAAADSRAPVAVAADDAKEVAVVIDDDSRKVSPSSSRTAKRAKTKTSKSAKGKSTTCLCEYGDTHQHRQRLARTDTGHTDCIDSNKGSEESEMEGGCEEQREVKDCALNRATGEESERVCRWVLMLCLAMGSSASSV